MEWPLLRALSSCLGHTPAPSLFGLNLFRERQRDPRQHALPWAGPQHNFMNPRRQQDLITLGLNLGAFPCLFSVKWDFLNLKSCNFGLYSWDLLPTSEMALGPGYILHIKKGFTWWLWEGLHHVLLSIAFLTFTREAWVASHNIGNSWFLT